MRRIDTGGRTEVLPGGQMPHLFWRAALSLTLAAGFVWLLTARLGELDLGAVGVAVSGVAALHWAAAAGATLISFWAVGHYDAVVHRHFATGVPSAVARRAGVSAIAISQMLGLGVITGAIVRWRMLPGQTPALATRLTVAVALSFLAGWGVVTSVVLLALPDAPFKPVAALVLLAAAGTLAVGIAGLAHRSGWPNVLTQVRLIGLAAVDTLAAALALYLLLPADLGLSLVHLLPAFLLAQGAGLVSGTPGGIGAFEVTLLALLPSVAAEPLLAAVLAWRIVYYALPAMLAAVLTALGPARLAPFTPAMPDTTRRARPRAEVAIRQQGEHAMLPCGTWLVARTPHLAVGMFDPLSPPRQALACLTDAAHGLGCWPVIYKCTGRMAVVARARGWHLHRVAREAWLDPQGFRLSDPARAGLRRKLRKAQAAGVTVHLAARLPLAAMARIAADWAAAHGGERGFSMGRYAPEYVAGQRVCLATHGDRLVAFATFHADAGEWTLDLMRHGADTPEGTMQALLACAISEAATLNVPRLSLAAVPEAAFAGGGALLRLQNTLGRKGAGLLQFKAAFAPRWQPLYLAAPRRAGLILAAAEIARAVVAPPGLPKSEQDHAEFEFASAAASWHRRIE